MFIAVGGFFAAGLISDSVNRANSANFLSDLQLTTNGDLGNLVLSSRRLINRWFWD